MKTQAQCVASDVSNQVMTKSEAMAFVKEMVEAGQMSEQMAKDVKRSLRSDFDWTMS